MKNTINERLKGMKILFATFPVDGHFNPLTGLAKHLQKEGCEVRWYTSDKFKDKLAKLGIRHYPFEKAYDISSADGDKLFVTRTLINDPVEKMNFGLINFFAERSSENFEDIQQIHESFPFDLVIADSTFPAIPFIKTKMNVPVVSIGVIPLAEASVDLAPYGLGLPPATNQDQRNKYAQLMLDLITRLKNGLNTFEARLNLYGIEYKRSQLFNTLIKTADLYLQIGSPDFEYKRSDIGDNIRFIGNLSSYPSTKEKPKWFDNRLLQYEKIVLVTQGTIEKNTSKLLEPTLEAFKDDESILLIVTTGGNQTAALRNKYVAKNVIIEDYIEFSAVMPYATVYVTNGGYGGTLMSIKNNLPMIAAGVHEFKNEVCARIGYFKLGVDLGTETPVAENIKHAADQIFSDPSFKNNVTRLNTEMEQLHPEKLCVQHIIDLMKQYNDQAF